MYAMYKGKLTRILSCYQVRVDKEEWTNGQMAINPHKRYLC